MVDQRDLLPELYAARYGQVNSGLLRILNLFEKLSQRSAEHPLRVSGYLRDRVLAGSGLPAGSVSVVRNGPVLARVAESTPDEALKRGHQHLGRRVGEIGLQDRVDLLIRSIHQVVRGLGRTDCLFAVIGDGECLAETRASPTSWT